MLSYAKAVNNIHHGSKETIIGYFDDMAPKEKLQSYPSEALWVLDRGMDNHKPGKTVVLVLYILLSL